MISAGFESVYNVVDITSDRRKYYMIGRNYDLDMSVITSNVVQNVFQKHGVQVLILIDVLIFRRTRFYNIIQFHFSIWHTLLMIKTSLSFKFWSGYLLTVIKRKIVLNTHVYLLVISFVSIQFHF